ncbi:Protein fem-1 homolog CG6966 [Gryllus bimaculatus]|nr:Protein fem-1 homolog CG6966 [Gryllus bimaculatus]
MRLSPPLQQTRASSCAAVLPPPGVNNRREYTARSPDSRAVGARKTFNFSRAMSVREAIGEASAGERDAMEGALLQAAIVIAEALRHRLEERAEQRARKAQAKREDADRARLQQVIMGIERKLESTADRSDVLEQRLERLEKKASTAVEQLLYFSDRESSYAQQSDLQMLERRLNILEMPSQRVLNESFPRESAFRSLEKPLPLKMGFAPVSGSPSRLFSARVLTPPTMMNTGDAEEANTGDILEQRKMKVLVQTVKMKRELARASPSPLGEDLCLAAYDGRLKDIRELVDSGADVNYTDKDGFTPLLRALCNLTPNTAVVSLLIDKGADISVVDSRGAAAMHFAAIYDCTGRCLKVLLGFGGNVNARDEQGVTTLHVAAGYDHVQVVELLLEAGARKDAKCWSGERKNALPFDYAQSDTVRELLRL